MTRRWTQELSEEQMHKVEQFLAVVGEVDVAAAVCDVLFRVGVRWFL